LFFEDGKLVLNQVLPAIQYSLSSLLEPGAVLTGCIYTGLTRRHFNQLVP
jgi:hypothetical protein